MNRRMSVFVAVAAGAFLALAMAPSTAATDVGSKTWYVGSVGGSGRCMLPDFGTISEGVAGASAGDTVVVCPGTYNEVVWVDKAITLRGKSGAVIRPDDGTRLLDQSAVPNRRAAVYITSDDVTIQGFEIDGTGGTVHYGVYAFECPDPYCTESLPYGSHARNVVVKGNTIHDLQNDVHDAAGVGILYFGWNHGIAGAVVERNTVYNTARHGIFVGGMRGDGVWLLSDGNAIEANNVYDTWQGFTADYGAGIQVNGAMDTVIVDNVVHHTGQPTAETFYPGMYVAGTASGNTIAYNNIHHNLYGLVVWVNAPFVDFDGQAPASPDIEHNKLHQNTICNLRVIL